MGKQVSVPVWLVWLMCGTVSFLAVSIVVIFAQWSIATDSVKVQSTAAGYWRQIAENRNGVMTVRDIEELDMHRVFNHRFDPMTEKRVAQRLYGVVANLEVAGFPNNGVFEEVALPMAEYLVMATWQPGATVKLDEANLALRLIESKRPWATPSDSVAQKISDLRDRFNRSIR